MPLDFNIPERDGRDLKQEFIDAMKICISPESTDEDKRKSEKIIMATIYLTMDIVKNVIPVGIQLQEFISWIRKNTDTEGLKKFKIYLESMLQRITDILGNELSSKEVLVSYVKVQIAVIIGFLEISKD